ncbi:uncharacterized protein LOC134181139 [Corticium candelabrum]|uniref:uncharacterized protein LOC134181139 n=1 Tax=Corticium candelabrum TaxID=121492 RepID=UPI002E25D61B|nr:uncharacterized protein LOC134181139 [Corticium candelabrum]
MPSLFLSLLLSLLYLVYADDVDEAEIYYRGNDLVLDAASGNVVIRHNSGNETSLHDVRQELQLMRNQISSVLAANCNDAIKKGLWLNVSSDGCMLSLPSCSGDGEVIAWEHTTSTFSCSSNLSQQTLGLQSQLKKALSQLKTLKSGAASAYVRLQGFIACQRKGMSYNETLDVCVPMVPECTRDGEILVWNVGENRYRCSSFLVDSVDALQTEIKRLSSQALRVNQIGDTPETAGITCRDVLQKRGKLPSGSYWIDPSASGNASKAFQVYCDMLTDGGGWSLVTVVKAANASYEKKYPVNGLNEDNMLADRTDKWASLSQIQLNQVYNAYNDTIMRVYTSAFISVHTGDRSPSPRTYYLQKMDNEKLNFDAFRAIRYVPLWGVRTKGDYKLNYFRDGLSNPYNHVTHSLTDSNRSKQLHHWEAHVVRVNGRFYTTSRHGIVGDAFSNCEWLYKFNFSSSRHKSSLLNCRADAVVYGKIWIK